MSRDVVYHFTTTANLPWILASGALMPTRCVDVGLGVSHFLWGTSDPTGDPTAAPFRKVHWHDAGDRDCYSHGHNWYSGEMRIVRFTLPGNAFLSWRETQQFEGWSPQQIADVIAQDHQDYGVFDHDTWRLRRDPLRLADVLAVEWTSYDDRETERWHAIDISDPAKILLPTNRVDLLGVLIGRRAFYSNRIVTPLHGLQFTFAYTDDDYAAEAYDARRAREQADLDAEYEDDDESEDDAEYEDDDE
jgi:hypothetical protein